MADVLASDYGKKPLHSVGAYGNAFNESYSVAKAANSGDIVVLGIIPAGIEVNRVYFVFDDCGTGVTGKLGYRPVSGSSPTAVDDYWLAAGQDLATAAGALESKAHPIKFDKDVAIILTVAGANFTSTPKVTAVVQGKVVGVP